MSFPYDPDGPFDDEMLVGRVSLDIQKLSTYRRVSGEFMRNHLRLSERRDALLSGVFDEMAYELSTMVQVHNLPPEEVVETGTLACDRPASWWQQWKQDVAANHRLLAWLVRRWPVRTVRTWHKLTLTVDLRRFRTYPDAPDLSRMDGYALSYMQHTLQVDHRWDSERDRP